MYIYIHVYLYIYIFIWCMHAYAYAYMHAYAHACICICMMHAYSYAYAWYMHIHLHAYANAYSCVGWETVFLNSFTTGGALTVRFGEEGGGFSKPLSNIIKRAFSFLNLRASRSGIKKLTSYGSQTSILDFTFSHFVLKKKTTLGTPFEIQWAPKRHPTSTN